jgi:hypothetical protein
MIVELDLRGGDVTARLVEPEDFRAFKAVLREAGPPLEERLAPAGIARVEEHVWVPVETLRELAGDAATAAWEESLLSMLEFARSRGWVDEETGALRAHVERPAGSEREGKAV